MERYAPEQLPSIRQRALETATEVQKANQIKANATPEKIVSNLQSQRFGTLQSLQRQQELVEQMGKMSPEDEAAFIKNTADVLENLQVVTDFKDAKGWSGIVPSLLRRAGALAGLSYKHLAKPTLDKVVVPTLKAADQGFRSTAGVASKIPLLQKVASDLERKGLRSYRTTRLN
jgi:hypothetical protein